MRIGEVKALRWREDVDLIAKTITVNQQTCYGETTTPKGRTRRDDPDDRDARTRRCRALEVVREGFVVRNLDGSAKTDGQANCVILRICRRAGLPDEALAHAAAHLRNPRRAVRREPVAAAVVDGAQADRRDDDLRPRGGEPSARDSGGGRGGGRGERDPDRRILKMLGARGSKRGSKPEASERKRLPRQPVRWWRLGGSNP